MRSQCEDQGATAVILAAGYATRLYPLTLNIPKPLLVVRQETTVVDFIVDQLEADAGACRGGLREIIVVTNGRFRRDFTEWARRRRGRLPLIVLDDGTRSNDDRLGAIGDIHFAVRERKVCGDLVVIGGDNLFDGGFGRFFEWAASNAPSPSLGLFDIGSRAEASRFGVVTVDAGNCVRTFEEKPAHPKSTLVATCLYYFPKETRPLLSRYVADPALSKDAPGNYIRWLKDRGAVYGFVLKKKHWVDIGHLDSYREVVARYNRCPGFGGQKRR